MIFKIVNSQYKCSENDVVYLLEDGWDDWFQYSTLYIMIYIDKKGVRHRIGGVKIGQRKQSERRPQLEESFEKLDHRFFSLGASDKYYENLNRLSNRSNLREEILDALNDIAKNLELLDEVVSLDVVKTSLLRDKTITTVRGQYHRMAGGGARLTDYNFSYCLPRRETENDDEDEKIKLEFDVIPEQIPPTNIHVLIGKNGVGKSTLLRNMLRSLQSTARREYGNMDMGDSNDFANIVFVSFSAFEEYLQIENREISYLHIGLLKKEGIKNHDELSEEFAESLYVISRKSRNDVWLKILSILESDNTFIELNIKGWSDVVYEESEVKEAEEQSPKMQGESLYEYNERIKKPIFIRKVVGKFKQLSSGHKVILLTIAKLVEAVEEKTLVILDEPEEHLHPPLVSAFIRALSYLLVYRNGVGIVATHSPVIVQEVPKKCVWILRRSGDELVVNRPQIETFGENLSVLTSEIFGFEVTNSGFHKMLNDTVAKQKNYKRALGVFRGELGEQGKIILKSLMYEKEHLEGELND